jgi:PAS domain S-box-containing protein
MNQDRLAAALIESALDAVIVMDQGGRVVEFNPMAERVFGYARAEAVGRALGELIVPPALRERHRAGYRRYIETGEARLIGTRIEIEAMRADGSTLPVEMTMTEVAIGGERMFAAHLRDMTEAHRAITEAAAQRERLAGLEKLSALGTLLGGVSHELNNPLSIILAQATLLLEKAREPDIKRRAERIHGAAERCSRILKSFMAMARQRGRAREAVAIGDVVRDALELTAYGRRSAGIETELSIGAGLGAVACDRDMVSQALAHLLVFAQARVSAAEGVRRISVTAAAGDGMVALEVADNGPDVPAAVLPRLFDPFAPTDPTGAGTGIGLHLAREAAVSHGGALEHRARPGGGAVFRMVLPLVAVPDAVAAAAGGLRILVVDDEPDVGRSLAELLEVLGHRAEVVDSPAEALRRVGEVTFDAVISDYRMPGMDGGRLLARVVAAVPGLRGRCILATGDMLGAERPGGGVQGGEVGEGPILMAKPFSLDDVRAALRRLE